MKEIYTYSHKSNLNTWSDVVTISQKQSQLQCIIAKSPLHLIVH